MLLLWSIYLSFVVFLDSSMIRSLLSSILFVCVCVCVYTTCFYYYYKCTFFAFIGVALINNISAICKFYIHIYILYCSLLKCSTTLTNHFFFSFFSISSCTISDYRSWIQPFKKIFSILRLIRDAGIILFSMYSNVAT